MARWRGCSLRPETMLCPSFSSIRISASSSRLSSPLGPLTETRVPSMRISTPEGMATGILPTRDIGSPHVAEYFATHAAAAGFLTGHNALRRGEDGDTKAAVDARDLALGRIDAQPRPAHALEAHDDRLARGGISEMDANIFVRAFAADLEVADIALVLEDLSQRYSRLGGGHVCVIVAGHERVPDPGEHVGDGIGNHFAYQLDFFTPGIWPSRANLRKQIRQRPNLRMYARGRPHRRQRLRRRTANFGALLNVFSKSAFR